MSETEVKTALTSNAPLYVDQASDDQDMHYLVAETEAESYAFTMIDGKVAAFSVMHILPPGQLPFLPPGQQPTVSIEARQLPARDGGGSPLGKARRAG
jgi:hypothetical protein